MEPDLLTIRPGWRAWWDELGEAFWSSPASSSGLYHHGESQEEHAREVFDLASWHWRRMPERRIRHDHGIRRSFLRAALFHDCGKALDRRNHDVAGFEWMRDRDPLAARLILLHMGRWGAREIADLMDRPANAYFRKLPFFSWMVQTLQACDYSAAHGWRRQ